MNAARIGARQVVPIIRGSAAQGPSEEIAAIQSVSNLVQGDRIDGTRRHKAAGVFVIAHACAASLQLGSYAELHRPNLY